MLSLFTDINKNTFMFILCLIISQGAAYILGKIPTEINDSGKVGIVTDYLLLSIILILVIIIVMCVGAALLYYRYLYYREKNRSKVKYSF